MSGQIENKFGKLLKAFLKERGILIVDSSTTTRTAVANSIATSLATQGLSGSLISTAANYEEAKHVATTTKIPIGILVTDYMIGEKSGLDLAEEIFRDCDDLQSFAVFVLTASAHQSAVVEAAEGLADTYVLKPFSDVILKEYFSKALAQKLTPNPLGGLSQKLRSLLRLKKYQEVLDLISSDSVLVALEKKGAFLPAIYRAQAYEGLKDSALAAKFFKLALQFKPEHYLALSGLYRLYLTSGQKTMAYEQLSQLNLLFPMSPQRLCEAIALGIEVGKFDDVDFYYKQFTLIGERREELTKTMSAALVIGALHRFRSKQPEEAISLFNKAIVTSRRNAHYISKAVLNCLANKEFRAAEKFFDMFDAVDMESMTYLSCKYLVKDRTGKKENGGEEQNFSLAMRLMSMPDCPLPVFRVALRYALSRANKALASQIRSNAMNRWPASEIDKPPYDEGEASGAVGESKKAA